MPRAGFEPAKNLSSDLVELSCSESITTTPRGLYETRTMEFHIICLTWS